MQALLASYEKNDDVLRLGRALQASEWELLGSAGTAKYLNENGIACRDIAEMVGTPILDHRVVTLSRELHAALLSRNEDAQELASLGLKPIDLVYVTFYPLEDAVAKNASPDEILEKTDIGGPTLLRSAAKGRRLALSHPSQIPVIEQWLAHGAPEDERRTFAEQFAAVAERRVADYVDASARYWEKRSA